MDTESKKVADHLRPVVYLTRIEHFSSAHRLHKGTWDEEKNKSVFGKCDNLHGHNYKLEVTVKGRIDEQTGMVMNIADLKDIIERSVLSLLDHRNIDEDVPYFRGHQTSTSENLAVFIWKQIAAEMPSNVTLHRIKLHETDKNVVEFTGEFA